jgi:hypothetical protein
MLQFIQIFFHLASKILSWIQAWPWEYRSERKSIFLSINRLTRFNYIWGVYSCLSSILHCEGGEFYRKDSIQLFTKGQGHSFQQSLSRLDIGLEHLLNSPKFQLNKDSLMAIQLALSVIPENVHVWPQTFVHIWVAGGTPWPRTIIPDFK